MLPRLLEENVFLKTKDSIEETFNIGT